MSIDLLHVGKFGLLNSQTLLNTTSNNINNVNTEGYVRKSTITYTNSIQWGVGETNTRRIYDRFVQRELYTDQARMAYYDKYSEGMTTVDKVLTDKSLSIANGLNDYFDSLADAVQNPTSAAEREQAMTTLNDVVERLGTVNQTIRGEITDINAKVADDVTQINDLVANIRQVNRQIRGTTNNNHIKEEIYLELLDKRDLLINQLSSLVDIKVIETNDGSLAVYLAQNGQLLTDGDTYAKLEARANEFDNTRSDIYLRFYNDTQMPADKSTVKLQDEQLGGELGGYLASTAEIRQTMRDLGQLALAFADAMNVQNKSGFTLEGEAGANLVNIMSVYAKTDDTKTSGQDSLLCTFTERMGKNITACDYEVSFKNGQLALFQVDEHGKRTDISGLVDNGTSGIVRSTDANGNLVLDLSEYAGVKFEFNQSEATLSAGYPDPSTGYQRFTTFYVQPTLDAAYNISTNITKPEDFAFAAAVRPITNTSQMDGRATSAANPDAANAGNAVMTLVSMSATGSDMGVVINPTTNLPEFNTTAGYLAPNKIMIDNSGNYVIYNVDSTGAQTYLGYADASTEGVNIFAQAHWYATNVAAPAGSGFPGYEVSVTGTVEPNDTFFLEINTNGVADNTNGVLMGNLRNQELMGTTRSQQTKVTFNEGYANLTTRLGAEVYSANNNLEAYTAKKEQTEALYTSDAGVNLDEEAANLLMYQQSYQACAKIIEASQTVFNALISSF